MARKLSPVGGSPYQAGHPASLACSTGVIFLAERKARDKRGARVTRDGIYILLLLLVKSKLSKAQFRRGASAMPK